MSMALVQDTRNQVAVIEGEDYRVFEDNRIEYTASGVQNLAPILRDHGFDIRTVATLDEHLEILWTCSVEAMMQAWTSPSEEAIRQRRILNHQAQFVKLTGQGKGALARLHEEAIYALEGLSKPEAKELYFLCHLYPELPLELG